MRQRVMIAMALAGKPDVLIADEPTTALDVTIQAQILDLIMDLQQETGMAVIFITHDLGVIAEICEVLVYVCRPDRGVRVGQRSFAEPKHPYTQGLLSAIPRLDTPRKNGCLQSKGRCPHFPNCPRAAGFKTDAPM